VSEPIACVAATTGESLGAAEEIAGRLPGFVLRPCSLARYLADPDAPRRIVLCAAGGSRTEDLIFLASAAARLFWPAPPADFRDAIGGLRTRPASPSRPAGRTVRTRRAPEALAAALLMEGRIDAARARKALRSSAPRDWIVESARHVHIGGSGLDGLARAGVRWSALEPVELVAVYASPGIARLRRRWAGSLPKKIRVWVADSSE
jgi:hypothetical protein